MWMRYSRKSDMFNSVGIAIDRVSDRLDRGGWSPSARLLNHICAKMAGNCFRRSIVQSGKGFRCPSCRTLRSTTDHSFIRLNAGKSTIGR
ncbi:hypothetical protein BDQ94DRAFT_154666 [Aspergillus welwitschiae]|uniref:Uncharacterized protein n=1 Tax=Aspergillus welwitschiae TaxID=1341132 RepID=A0A3F3PJF3_9EURO|nr:hypothetical protein BDQ94DRAFT_154666 [Aspergillus welwitschiae]RDH27018.1 hypothetical protein BDQ94DRAFT_154666 [Aspergillus welwitschiae]